MCVCVGGGGGGGPLHYVSDTLFLELIHPTETQKCYTAVPHGKKLYQKLQETCRTTLVCESSQFTIMGAILYKTCHWDF